ncbi:MAG: polysaccharide deacetylase family protein [Nitrosomonas sp.]|nr:polysaccharide deacetylase family protein [Nitrosomonas sp.]
MSNARKIVVFTGDLSHAVRRGIVNIDQAISDLSWLVVVHAPIKTPKILLRNQWRNLRYHGWRWILYQTLDIVQLLLNRSTSDIAPAAPGYRYTFAALKQRANVQIVTVDDIHADNSLNIVREFSPDLGLSLAAPILKGSLFNIPRLGTLNLHKGKVPDFKGMPPAFWELHHDVPSVGCTVHWVEARLDAGAVVKQVSVPRAPYSTLKGLQLTLDETGIELMKQSVQDVLNGTAASTPQAAGGHTYKKPTLSQVAALKRKLARQQQQTRFSPKLIAFMGYILLNKLFLHRLMAPRITVLLYHRVTDDARDNLSVGIEQFDRHMALIRKYCTILSIEQIAATSTISHSAKPLVCVTFDDGYLDNFANAVPILTKHGIPAAFFVSTGMIDNDGIFPHDIRRGNDKIPVMNWSQLQQMHAEGFAIGSHTVNHIDCAKETAERVCDELRVSKNRLQQQLKLPEVLFAYPYGGRQHMTAERLELVKQAGYSACLSAYGGINVSSMDRFNIMRNGIHYEFSDLALLFKCQGLR